jgi:hypothetical protein
MMEKSMNYAGVIIAVFLVIPLMANNQLQTRKSSSLNHSEEKKILIKRYCKITIHTIELLSGLANLVMCGCLVAHDPRENPTFAEQCFAFTKLGIVGPALTLGGIIGLYEDATVVTKPSQPKPSIQNIVQVITHTNVK